MITGVAKVLPQILKADDPIHEQLAGGVGVKTEVAQGGRAGLAALQVGVKHLGVEAARQELVLVAVLPGIAGQDLVPRVALAAELEVAVPDAAGDAGADVAGADVVVEVATQDLLALRH